MDMRSYKIPDRYDMIEFTGTLIGKSSTETPDSSRWTEIEIYRTESGKYVVRRIGRSAVYHRFDGPCNTGNPVEIGTLDVDFHEPCAVCNPPEADEVPPETMVHQEVDKNQADVCDDASKVCPLLTVNRGGTRFLSQPAVRALDMARLNDPELAHVVGSVRKID